MKIPNTIHEKKNKNKAKANEKLILRQALIIYPWLKIKSRPAHVDKSNKRKILQTKQKYFLSY